MESRQNVAPFGRLLIANRGEIAVRVIRACRELGVSPVAVYGEGEERAPHVRLADDAYRVPPGAGLPYLDVAALVGIAVRAGAAAVHPGYGFLAEHAGFAEACAAARIVFVGPPPAAIRGMGDKVEARRLASAAGVPTVPGSDGPIGSVAEALAWAAASTTGRLDRHRVGVAGGRCRRPGQRLGHRADRPVGTGHGRHPGR